MARIGEDRRIHVVKPAPAVPDTPEPLTVPAPGAPTDPTRRGAPGSEPEPVTAE